MSLKNLKAGADGFRQHFSSGSSRPQAWFRAGLIFSLVYLAVQAIGLGLLPAADQRIALNNVTALVSAGLACLSAFYASWVVRSRRHLCLAWRLLAVSMLAAFIAGLLSSAQAILFGQVPFPSVSDGLYLSIYPLLMIMTIIFPGEAPLRLEFIEWGFDAVIVALSGSLLFWYFLVGSNLLNSGAPLLNMLVSAAYSVGDLVLLWALTMLILRRFSSLQRRPLWWLGGALAATVVYDLWTTVWAQSGSAVPYSSTPMELLATASMLMLMLAGWQQAMLTATSAATASPRVQVGRAGALRRLVPYVWLLPAYAVVVASLNSKSATNPTLVSLWVALIIALVIVRQMLALGENQRLSTQLGRSNADLGAMNATLQLEISERRRAETIIQAQNEKLEAQNQELRAQREDLQRVQSNLQQSEARYRELVDNQGEGLGLLDREERFVFVNPAAEEIFGVAAGQLVSCCMLDFLSPEQQAEVHRQIGLRRAGVKSVYELELLRADGQRAVILVTALPRFDAAGQFTGTFGVFRDITERKQAEEQVRCLNAELEQRVAARTAELSQLNAVLTREVVERQRAETVLQASLHEKEVLLKEIHHRVKNNLQVISSLLNLQAKQVKHNPEAEAALRESQQRVRSMALIHEKLYQSQSLAEINLADYIRHLAASMVRSYQGGVEVDLRLDLEAVALGVDQAVPCGLILNELITNALKYAFSGQERGVLCIDLHAEPGGMVHLRVADDGPGLPPGLDISRTSSLGLQLVASLVTQLQGSVGVNGTGGAEFLIMFPYPV
jgi:PAS domain S-box-containing protein